MKKFIYVVIHLLFYLNKKSVELVDQPNEFCFFNFMPCL